MVKGLDRPMFSGQQPTGLGAFQGRALQQRGMPMSGIMKFAGGGDVDKEKKVADAYKPQEAGIREGSFIDYLTDDSGGGYRGDLADIGAKILGAPYDLPISAIEELGVTMPEGSQSGTGYSTIMGGLDELLGVENRLPSETFFPEDVQWEDPEGNRITQSQAEEINKQLLGQTEEAITDPKAQQTGDAVTTDANEKLNKAEANEDIYGTMLALVPDAQVSDDPEENRKEVMRRLQQQAASMGMELDDEEADPQLNPHIGTALILAGGAMMQQTGNVGQAIGKGLETGASFLANKAEKEAERAADLQTARIAAAAGTSDIQNTRYQTQLYSKYFPDATEATILRKANRSAAADPSMLIPAGAEEMYKKNDASSLAVAENYETMRVYSADTKDLVRSYGPNPAVAVDPEGNYLTFDDVLQGAKAAMDADKNLNFADAVFAAGYRPIDYFSIGEATRQYYAPKKK